MAFIPRELLRQTIWDCRHYWPMPLKFCIVYRGYIYVRLFLDIRSKTQGEKKLKLKLKLKKNAQNSIFFRNSRRFLTKYYNFYLKSGKIVQKLKNLPKTQGKISKNLKFPANPLSSKAGKTSKKKPALGKKEQISREKFQGFLWIRVLGKFLSFWTILPDFRQKS